MPNEERPQPFTSPESPAEPDQLTEVGENDETAFLGLLREAVETRFTYQDVTGQVPDRNVDEYVDTLVREWQQRIVLDLEERVALGVESFLDDLAALRGDSTADVRLSAGPETEV
jgi:hypothetical protein